MKFSTKFRLSSQYKVTSFVKQLIWDLNLFINKVAFSFNKPVAYFNQLKCLVINKFQSDLLNNLSYIVSFDEFRLNKSIKNLQNNFIIICVDKAPNIIML